MDIIFRWYFEMNFQSTEAKAASSEVFAKLIELNINSLNW